MAAEGDTAIESVGAPRESRKPNPGLRMGLPWEEAKHIPMMEGVGKPKLAAEVVGCMQNTGSGAEMVVEAVEMRRNVGPEEVGKPEVGVEGAPGPSFLGSFPIQYSDFPLHSPEGGIEVVPRVAEEDGLGREEA